MIAFAVVISGVMIGGQAFGSAPPGAVLVGHCRISELMTFVSEYVTQNVRINDIEATHALSVQVA